MSERRHNVFPNLCLLSSKDSCKTLFCITQFHCVGTKLWVYAPVIEFAFPFYKTAIRKARRRFITAGYSAPHCRTPAGTRRDVGIVPYRGAAHPNQSVRMKNVRRIRTLKVKRSMKKTVTAGTPRRPRTAFSGARETPRRSRGYRPGACRERRKTAPGSRRESTRTDRCGH